MSNTLSTFPLSGVIGIVDASPQQLDLALKSGLRCVEVRADLLRTAGLSDDELLSVISTASASGLACLFTLRHADQGGTFNASEAERIALCKQALKAGANMIDLEHGTEASSVMLQSAAPMILSYHNFEAMLDAEQLASLTDDMQSQGPAAIKIIPTGNSIDDAATMLSWVGAAKGHVRRIGFAMGADGATSRILCLAQGAPVTYASFGEPVAPGQIDIALLLDRYNCMQMNSDTTSIALLGTPEQIDQYVLEQQDTSTPQANNVTYIGFAIEERAKLAQHRQAMKISDIRIL